MAPKNRPATHPGEILLKDFLEPLGLSQKQFAEHLGYQKYVPRIPVYGIT